MPSIFRDGGGDARPIIVQSIALDNRFALKTSNQRIATRTVCAYRNFLTTHMPLDSASIL
jgi:hypothetical protein